MVVAPPTPARPPRADPPMATRLLTAATMADAPQQPQLPRDPQHEVLETLGEHTDRLDSLTDLTGEHDKLLAELRETVKALLPDNAGMGHQPIPAPQWHQLTGDERD